MKLSINEWKEKMVSYVKEVLITKYHFNQDEANIMVQNSTFLDMLDDDPEITMHYSAEYWAKDILNENMMVCI